VARNGLDGPSPTGERRAVGLAILFGGVVLVGVILVFALTGGGGETAAQDGASPQGATTDDAPAAPEKPAVEAEPVSRPSGENENEATTPHEGATHEPGGYDPLETGAEPGDLSETEKGRATMAATNFVLAAYGYKGKNQQEYSTVLNRTIFPWSFYESPGGAYVKDYRRRINDGGIKSSAVVDRFEMKETSLEEVKGVVHFVVKDDLGKRSLSQKLTLKPHRAIWRVSGAGEIRTQG
jgi:hypothetical protein